jgi:hypothetical protein
MIRTYRSWRVQRLDCAIWFRLLVPKENFAATAFRGPQSLIRVLPLVVHSVTHQRQTDQPTTKYHYHHYRGGFGGPRCHPPDDVVSKRHRRYHHHWHGEVDDHPRVPPPIGVPVVVVVAVSHYCCCSSFSSGKSPERQPGIILTKQGATGRKENQAFPAMPSRRATWLGQFLGLVRDSSG